MRYGWSMPNTFIALDPRYLDIAGEYLHAQLSEDVALSDKQLEALRDRVARAMQQAAEQEWQAVQRELEIGR